MATLKPVEEFRGDTWLRTWAIQVDEKPIDIVGATVRLDIKDNINSDTFIFRITTTPSTDGVITLSIEPASVKYPDGRTIIFLRVEKEAMEQLVPKKSYFFDLEYKNRRPQACQEADPELPYCQIIGKYQVLLDGYSTIKPYSHMNEKCPSVAPTFFRPADC
jgi:hypothetical protein